MIEILNKDLLGRVAKFRTKSGSVETPAFLPVVNPSKVLVSPRQLFEEFKCSIIIVNAYLLLKTQREGDIHDFLDFPGSIMTDSGAYQLLVYGQVDVSPSQIVHFQERIGSDLAVILDVPTGGHATYTQALATVEETVRRAKESITLRTRSDILWVAPVQGGTHPVLVAESAKELSKLDFSLFALGSPTQLMERYQFAQLVDLVMAARRNLPSHKPIHLFGAGHPMVFPLIVAMGCDMFDSAAYALYAQNDRMLTSDGTYRLNEVQENFCYCPTCKRYTISEMKRLEQRERAQILAEHNLHVCFHEIARIKQAIKEGRLWRLVESRLSSHPSLVDAMCRLSMNTSYIEQFSPISKKRALFMSTNWSLSQPEVVRHQTRVGSYSLPTSTRNLLLLMEAPRSRPYYSSPRYLEVERALEEFAPSMLDRLHIVFVSPYFGLVPFEISGVYPLTQNETPNSPPANWTTRISDHIFQYVENHNQYRGLVGFFPEEEGWRNLARLCARHLKKKMGFVVCVHDGFRRQSLRRIAYRIARVLQKERA
jgi:7-cyano-7-deazaguanine tRNA-ribosyltransferase